MYKTYIK